MLTVYDSTDGALIKREDAAGVSLATIWLDLLNPTKEEDRFSRGSPHNGTDARGNGRDRGIEPPLSGGRSATT